MKPCEHKSCTFPAEYRVKFYKNDELIAVNLCDKHMHDCIIQGLAFRYKLKFKIKAIIPIEEFRNYE